MNPRHLSWTRRLLGMNDAGEACRIERQAIRAASPQAGVQSAFANAMMRMRSVPNAAIGHAAADASVAVRLCLPDLVGDGHGLIVGGSGSGKTRLAAAIVEWLLRCNAEQDQSVGVWIQDHKSEFVELIRMVIAGLLDTLPRTQANALLDRIIVINPFSTSALVPMQILKPEIGVRPEDQAYEVTTLINRAAGADLGIRQDDFLYHVLLLGITTRRSLPDISQLLGDLAQLVRASRESPSEEVRAYFGTADRKQLTGGSLEGVRARLNKLLRLPATRLMLGAKDSLSFHRLLSKSVVLVDVGSPPFGCEDIGRFWSGLLTLKLTRAMFERTLVDAKRPVIVAIDEWQEGLAAGGDIAENYERVLNMARARGIGMLLISQSLAGAAKISASLPKAVATNMNLQACFRASPEDARAMSHMLPVTGRRSRPASAPWEDAGRSPFLSRAEELEVMTRQISSLPSRTFYYHNRRLSCPAELVRTVDVSPKQRQLSPAVRRQLRDGGLGIPIEELRRDVEDRRQSTFRVIDDEALVGPTRKPKGIPQ